MTYGRHSRKTLLHSQNTVTDSRIHSIESYEYVARRTIVQIQRLNEKDLLALVRFLFLRGNHVSYDSCNDHNVSAFGLLI